MTSGETSSPKVFGTLGTAPYAPTLARSLADVVRNRMPRGLLHLEKLLTRKKQGGTAKKCRERVSEHYRPSKQAELERVSGRVAKDFPPGCARIACIFVAGE